ncbi:MAG: protein kinase domain-containing protein [Stenotrophomonas sp.]
MDRDSWQQVRELFDAVCDLPSTLWSTELARLSANPAVIAETLQLLQAQTQDLGRARQPMEEMLAATVASELASGDRLGPWRLGERLATGGMGIVFRAERADGLYAQAVAIKFLQGKASARVSAHLAAERRILASLQHPNIARLYDGGTTPGGHPYLVMEYVQGEALDVYCRRHQLGLEPRLRLFLKVCRAVQVAHARLVLHCDLKPSNILVRADGEPVLLDFGVARLLGDPGGADGTPFFTPAYAPPELQRGEVACVASDVFSLGIVLTELCAGKSTGRTSADAAVAVVAPSVLADAGCPWRRRLRGDLDAIGTRAGARLPEQRYASVEALVADVQRHLEQRPVQARQGGRGYRGGRWMRRHWKGLGMMAGIVVLAAGFVWRLAEARVAAEREAQVAEQVSAFLVSMFEAADPRARGARGGDTITARELLERAAGQLDQGLQAAPDVQARLQGVIGLAYKNMGDVRRAQPMMLASAQALAEQGGTRNRDEAARMFNLLAGSYAADRRGVQGAAMARRALALWADDAPDSFRVAQANNSLGLSLLSEQRYDEAEAAFKQALQRHQAAKREQFIGVALDNLGMLYRRKGDLAASAAAFDRSTPMFRQMFGEMSYDFWASNTERTLMLADAGQLDEAVAAFEASLVRAPEIFGEHSVYVASENSRLALTLIRQGQYRRARPYVDTAVQLAAEVMGKDSYTYSLALENAAGLAAATGDVAAAEAGYRTVLAIREASIGPGHPDTLDAALQWGLLLARQGSDEGDGLLQRAHAQWLTRIPADSANGIRVRQGWAEWLMLKGRLPEATTALQALEQVAHASSPHAAIGQQMLQARRAHHEGNTAAAVRGWTRVVAMAEPLYGPDSALTAQWRVALADALYAADQRQAATLQANRAAPVLEAELRPHSHWRRRLQALRG